MRSLSVGVFVMKGLCREQMLAQVSRGGLIALPNAVRASGDAGIKLSWAPAVFHERLRRIPLGFSCSARRSPARPFLPCTPTSSEQRRPRRRCRAAMALQTLSTTGTSPAATASPTVDPTPGEGAQLNTRNSVPFSFLIAFLALFVVFMGMGLWARRIVFFARRQLGLPIPEPPRRRRPVLAQKPVLWDVYPDSRVQPQKWEGMEVSQPALS